MISRLGCQRALIGWLYPKKVADIGKKEVIGPKDYRGIPRTIFLRSGLEIKNYIFSRELNELNLLIVTWL
jgi:hypothetical protein